MITHLKRTLVVLGASVLVVAAAFFYWQHLTGERDAFQEEAEHQRERAEILQEHQQWQREQIETLHTALAARDAMLTEIADDMRASRDALDQLGEQNAEIRAWLDRDVPAGIDSWVRELQQPSASDGVRLPNGTGSANE